MLPLPPRRRRALAASCSEHHHPPRPSCSLSQKRVLEFSVFFVMMLPFSFSPLFGIGKGRAGFTIGIWCYAIGLILSAAGFSVHLCLT